MAMFSKRHYVAVADVLYRQMTDLYNQGKLANSPEAKTLAHSVSRFSNMFAEDNSKFDAEQFRKQVYLMRT